MPSSFTFLCVQRRRISLSLSLFLSLSAPRELHQYASNHNHPHYLIYTLLWVNQNRAKVAKTTSFLPHLFLHDFSFPIAGTIMIGIMWDGIFSYVFIMIIIGIICMHHYYSAMRNANLWRLLSSFAIMWAVSL